MSYKFVTQEDIDNAQADWETTGMAVELIKVCDALLSERDAYAEAAIRLEGEEQVNEHSTHFDDCGCLLEKHQKEIAKWKALAKELMLDLENAQDSLGLILDASGLERRIIRYQKTIAKAREAGL